MLNLLIGPIAEIAGTWMSGKVEQTKANAQTKVAKAQAEAVVMQKKATGEIDWDLEMAKGSSNSWKDEWLTILFSISLTTSLSIRSCRLYFIFFSFVIHPYRKCTCHGPRDYTH